MIYTCICHWREPEATEHYLMLIYGPPQKQQSSMSTLVLRFNFRERGWRLLQQSRNIDADAQQLTEAWDPSQCKQHNLSHHISLPEPSCWTLTEGHYKADPWPFIFTMSWLMKRSVWLLVSMLKEKESCVPYSDFNIWPLTIKNLTSFQLNFFQPVPDRQHPCKRKLSQRPWPLTWWWSVHPWVYICAKCEDLPSGCSFLN